MTLRSWLCTPWNMAGWKSITASAQFPGVTICWKDMVHLHCEAFSGKARKKGSPQCRGEPPQSVGIDQNDLGVGERHDLDLCETGDRRAVARLDAHAVDLDGSGGRHQISVPLRIQIERDP